MTQTSSGTSVSNKPKLSPLQQVICAWPLALVVIGGAFGGACGGLAWAINAKIMASSMSAPARYALIVLTGLGAIALYFAGVFVLVRLFPGVFAAH